MLSELVVDPAPEGTDLMLASPFLPAKPSVAWTVEWGDMRTRRPSMCCETQGLAAPDKEVPALAWRKQSKIIIFFGVMDAKTNVLYNIICVFILLNFYFSIEPTITFLPSTWNRQQLKFKENIIIWLC